MVTVSVVIPTYNRADVLPRAIDSALEQTYEDIEVIVVDDGSTDNTGDIINSYGEDRVRYIQIENNVGANAARTKGIKSATGEYIGFLDSDDEWLPEKTEKQIKALQSANADVAYTGIRQVDEKGDHIATKTSTISGDIAEDLLQGNFIGSYSAVMVSQELVDKVGYPDHELPCWQDWEWYLRLSDHGQFVTVNQPHVVRHNEGGQISGNFQYTLDVSDYLLKQLQKRASNKAQAKRAEAFLNFHVGYSALSNHQYTIARSRFFQSIKLSPMEFKFYVYLAVSSRLYPSIRGFKRILAQGIRRVL